MRALSAVLLVLALAGCGAGRFPEGSTMERIHDRGVLTVGVKFDQPGFAQKDPVTGRIVGFDAEFARMLARDLTGSEHNIRFVESISKNREKFLKEGVVDLVIATYSITAERSRVVGFAGPYYFASLGIMKRKDDSRLGSWKDLAGRRVCTVIGSTSAKRLRAVVPTARLVLVDAYGQCIEPLLDGRIDAVSTDDAILLGLLSRRPGAFALLKDSLASERYGIGIKHGDTGFQRYLNRFLAAALRDGSWERTYRETIGRLEESLGDTGRDAARKPPPPV